MSVEEVIAKMSVEAVIAMKNVEEVIAKMTGSAKMTKKWVIVAAIVAVTESAAECVILADVICSPRRVGNECSLPFLIKDLL